MAADTFRGDGSIPEAGRPKPTPAEITAMSHDHHVPTASEKLRREPSERLFGPFQRFASSSSSGGIVLLAMTIIAMIWANSKYAHTYDEIFHDTQIAVSVEHHPHHAGGHGDDGGHGEDHSAADEAVVGHEQEHGEHHGAIVSAMDGHGIPEGTPELVEEHAGDLHADEHATHGDGAHDEKKPYFFLGHGLTHWINDLLMAVF
ncbi:MAG: Na+/H+ antiporter NhaA, partial [Planctomycetota bacterium]